MSDVIPTPEEAAYLVEYVDRLDRDDLIPISSQCWRHNSQP